MSMVVQPGQVSLRQLEEIFRDQTPVRLDRNVKPDVERAAAIIAKAAKGDAAVYGVNTGFGKLAKPGSRWMIRPRCSATLSFPIQAALASRLRIISCV